MLTAILNSPIGPLHLQIEHNSLVQLDFDEEAMVEPSNQKVKVISKKSEKPIPEKSEIEVLNQAMLELSEYFAGTRQVFTVPIRLSGTEFRKKVWKRLEAIPYGVVKSYGQIASEINNPKSSRAVGGACGSNPVAIIVPCHRVKGSNGKLTGFGGGLTRKAYLLELENRQIQLYQKQAI